MIVRYLAANQAHVVTMGPGSLDIVAIGPNNRRLFATMAELQRELHRCGLTALRNGEVVLADRPATAWPKGATV